MNECEFCPPVHFESHSLCHSQFNKFAQFLYIIEADKENVSMALRSRVAECLAEIKNTYQHSTTDRDFLKLGKRLQCFNQILELVFKICDLQN